MKTQDFRTMSYPDRWKDAVRQGAMLIVFVPKPEANTGIAPHSGIVGAPLVDGTVLVHFEGWVHGAMQYAHLDARGKWEAGVKHAAGRALTHYPTVARRVLRLEDLNAVGTYIAAEDRIDLTDEPEVERWLT